MSIPLENITLSCFWQQGQNSGIEETESGPQYKECWKGSYSSAKNLLNSVSYGTNITSVHSALGFNRVSYYNAPSCPTRNGKTGVWKLNSIRVEEGIAGTNSLVYLVFYADYNDFVGEFTDDPESDVWNLDWIAYSVSPYNFIANEEHQDVEITTQSEVAIDWTSTAKRDHIEQYINYRADNKGNDFCYREQMTDSPNNYLKMLNGAEQEVYKKISLNRNATYHYPQITHTTAKLGNLSSEQSYPTTLGGSLDVVSNSLPSGCPYKFSQYQGKDYKWIKVGDSMTQTKNKKQGQNRWERKETWCGFTEVDMNYYGSGNFSHTENGIKNGRWQLEKL